MIALSIHLMSRSQRNGRSDRQELKKLQPRLLLGQLRELSGQLQKALQFLFFYALESQRYFLMAHANRKTQDRKSG